MTPTRINDFLLSLAVAIANAAQLTFAQHLFAHNAPEDHAAAVYTVLRIYGGNEPPRYGDRRLATVSVQHDTRGMDDASVLAQAWKVHESLLDDRGRLRHDWQIPGKRFAADGSIEADPAGNWVAWVRQIGTVPGIVGVDEKPRLIAMGNFDVSFQRAGA